MKIYKVCEYGTKKELFIGNKEDCCKYLNVNEKQFERQVKKFEDGNFTGQRIGYTISRVEPKFEFERCKKIVDRFYQEYWRSPTKEEFKACGGDLKVAVKTGTTYVGFIELCGYSLARNDKTIEAINEKGEVVFVGNRHDIAYEYNVKNPNSIASYISSGKHGVDIDGNRVTFRYKEFTGLKGVKE